MAHYKGAASEAGRALQLLKKREIAQQEIEFRKKKIEEDLKISNIENKFATHYDAVEQQLKTSTIGLVTLDEMKAKQEDIVREREKKLALKKEEKNKEKMKELEAKQEEKNKQKRQIQALSFNLNEDDEENENDDSADSEEDIKLDIKPGSSKEEPPKPKWMDEDIESKPNKKIKKNPDVDTSFLPDREREEQENKLREELRQEWLSKQAMLKDQEIPITFSYWDGSGHRKSIVMKKGNSIYQFLQKSLEMLRKEFSELKTVMADQLMYVKEDLILPHHYTFYDFIVTKVGFLQFCGYFRYLNTLIIAGTR
jgi:protein FAM50